MLRKVTVAGIQAFGCFVEVLPGQQGLVHVSELDLGRTDDPSTCWTIGDTMDVMCLANDGKVKLSRSAAASVIDMQCQVLSNDAHRRIQTMTQSWTEWKSVVFCVTARLHGVGSSDGTKTGSSCST